MAPLQRIDSSVLQQLQGLLSDANIGIRPVSVAYKDYSVTNKDSSSKTPLQFQWSHSGQVEQIFFGFYTWNTAESKKYPNTFLALGTSVDFRIVGFPLYLLPQDQEFIYLSFKLGNKEGGKNRWFGRGRSAKELRSVGQTEQLALDIRHALQTVFPTPLFTHPTLSGEWLTLARLPLADLQKQADLIQRTALKTLICERLLQAFVIAEKLRDESLQLEALNSRLEQLLDRDHCLGHALLLRVQHLDDLRTTFQRSILPLLQEYFFGDWGKIGLVLGEAFIHVSQPNEPGRYPLAKFKGHDAAGLRERPVYRLADVASLPAAAFQQLYASA